MPVAAGLGLEELVMPEQLLDAIRTGVGDLSSGENLQPLPGFLAYAGIFCDTLIGLLLEGPAHYVLPHGFHLEADYGVILFPLSTNT
jgi:hypothetical protein